MFVHLKKKTLTGNQVGNEGALKVSEVLLMNSSITELNLSCDIMAKTDEMKDNKAFREKQQTILDKMEQLPCGKH